MSLTGILLGIINAAIVLGILSFIGALIVWVLAAIAGVAIPENVRRLYLVIVALIAVYMLVALLLDPTLKVVQHRGLDIGGRLAAIPPIISDER